jgi:hypothetical protein
VGTVKETERERAEKRSSLWAATPCGMADGQTGQSGQTSVDDCFLPSGTCTAGAGTVMGLPTGYGYLRHPAGSFRLASMNTEPRASTTWCGQALTLMGLLNLMVTNIELQMNLFQCFPSYEDMFDCFWTPYVLMLIVKESNQYASEVTNTSNGETRQNWLESFVYIEVEGAAILCI